MKADRQKLGILSRSAQFERADIDEKERTVSLSFSSEQPVERWFGFEILDHNPKSVRMDRLKGSAPLLLNHNRDDQIGVVETASVEGDRKGRALVRFGTSQRAQEIFEDVKAGIRKLVSVGYRIHKMVTEKIEAETETLRAMDWEPLEISIVSVPADISVGVGRGAEEVETIIERTQKNMDPIPPGALAAPTATPPNIEVIREAARKDAIAAERQRVTDIRKMADGVINIIPKARELAEVAIAGDADTSAFQRTLNENFPKQQHVEAGGAPPIGMNKRDLKDYSFLRAINSLKTDKRLEGLEREASDAVAKQLGRSPEGLGFFIPSDIMRGTMSDELRTAVALLNHTRALQTNVFSGAGAVVGTSLLSGSLIELLRNNMVVMALGARSLSGLSGNVAIPRQTGGGTAYWLGEGATVTESAQTVGQLSLTPHRLSAFTSYSNQLLTQSSIDLEAFVRNDLMTVLALAKDSAAIVGTGSVGQPLGICNTTGLATSVTLANAGTMTYAEAVRFQTNVDTSNALLGTLGYLATKAIKGVAKTTAMFSSTGMPVWQGDSVDGIRALASNQLTGVAATVVFGNWADLIIAEWGANEVVVDPFTRAAQDEVKIYVRQFTDNGVRHATSFSQSTN